MRRILPVVGVVVLVLVLGFVVLGSCSGDSAADKYRSYVQDVNSVARQSNTDARTLDATLYNQELTPSQVTTQVANLIPRARATETTAGALKPTGKIKQQDLQRYLLQALQYRTLALEDLEAALKKALQGSAGTPATEAQRDAVANAYSELIASDIVYAASFQRPAQQVLENENVTDAPITDSVWALSPELANPAPNGNGLWIESVRDAGESKPCADGVIGTSIDEVSANGKTLRPAPPPAARSRPSSSRSRAPSRSRSRTTAAVPSAASRCTSPRAPSAAERARQVAAAERDRHHRRSPPRATPARPRSTSPSRPSPASRTENNHYIYHVAFQAS